VAFVPMGRPVRRLSPATTGRSSTPTIRIGCAASAPRSAP
jgi:hypothetical protein